MIRLNVFFEVADANEIARVISLGNELTECSLTDNGCIAYGMFQSTTNPAVFTICETWKDEESLKAHSEASHFTSIVPRLQDLSKNGLKLERFNF